MRKQQRYLYSDKQTRTARVYIIHTGSGREKAKATMHLTIDKRQEDQGIQRRQIFGQRKFHEPPRICGPFVY